jgi:recombination protein U
VKDQSKANRGRDFEELVDLANEWYNSRGIAALQKVPTHWTVRRKFDPFKNQSIIVSAFPTRKSTVDYIGLYYNRPIAFDAKSTRNKTRFPLNNIEEHQIKFLEQWQALSGKAFFLIHFSIFDETYILSLKKMNEFKAENERNSIPIDFFRNNCRKVTGEGSNPLHYLKDMY